MKYFLTILIASFFMVSPPSLSEVRKSYVVAVNDKEAAFQLNEDLANIKKEDKKTVVAYKGAVLTLMAKFTKTIREKKIFFTEGATLLEYAILEEPNNIEARYIRLGIQENAPKIVGYQKNKKEDKRFILDHYNELSSKELKELIKNFVMLSPSFSEEEKALIN